MRRSGRGTAYCGTAAAVEFMVNPGIVTACGEVGETGSWTRSDRRREVARRILRNRRRGDGRRLETHSVRGFDMAAQDFQPSRGRGLAHLRLSRRVVAKDARVGLGCPRPAVNLTLTQQTDECCRGQELESEYRYPEAERIQTENHTKLMGPIKITHRSLQTRVAISRES